MEQQSSPAIPPPSSTRKRRKSSRFRKLSILSVKSLLNDEKSNDASEERSNLFQDFLRLCPCLLKTSNYANGRILMIKTGAMEKPAEEHFGAIPDIKGIYLLFVPYIVTHN